MLAYAASHRTAVANVTSTLRIQMKSAGGSDASDVGAGPPNIGSRFPIWVGPRSTACSVGS